MTGESHLTTEIDIYAYAISCVEILTKGSLPWPMMDDVGIRHSVLGVLSLAVPLLLYR